MDEIEILQARMAELESILANEPLTFAQGMAVTDEMIDIDCALQRLFAPLETISDARLCASFGAGL